MASVRADTGPQLLKLTAVPGHYSHHEVFNFEAMTDQEVEAVHIERYRKRMQIALGACDCFHCNPKLYSMPKHGLYPTPTQADSLEWRCHDPLRLAEVVVKANCKKEATEEAVAAQRRWIYWRLRNRLRKGPRPNIPALLNPQTLPFIIDCFSDLFFSGLLPASTLVCLWRNFSADDRHKYGVTVPPLHPGGNTQIFLNQCQPQVVHSLEMTVRVILHEMIHALFYRHGCSSRMNGSQCEWESTGLCSRFWYANLGFTGHGRAWQRIAKTIGYNMRKKLGIAGHLGRNDALGEELASNNALPCRYDIRALYPRMKNWKLIPDMRHHLKGIREQSHASFFERPVKRRRYSDSVVAYGLGQRLFRGPSTIESVA